MEKYRNNCLEMIAPTQLKVVFLILEHVCRIKFRRLSIILLWFLTSNSRFVCFFFALSVFGIGSFFLHKDDFFR